jgi:hypothetical protein
VLIQPGIVVLVEYTVAVLVGNLELPMLLALVAVVQCELFGALAEPFHLLTQETYDAFIYSFTKRCSI